MSFKKYIISKMPYLIINLSLFSLISLLMGVSKFNIISIMWLFIIWFMPLIVYINLEFLHKKKFYNEINSVMSSLDKKYLLPEIIKKPKSYEELLIYKTLGESNREMHEHVNKYKNLQREYREYIEAWVHEIKTPVASLSLVAENSEGKLKKTIEDETKNIETYIEQALYYARSTNVSKDYIVKEFHIKEVVQKVIRKNRRELINKKFKIDIKGIEGTVITDSKWIEFIINQVIINSIKYSNKDNGELKIYTKKYENKLMLLIEDNGIGILEKDINRVFDKGFTGENGRKYGKSTGIGLYLCKILCEKLGLGIKLESKEGYGSKVIIIFPTGGHVKI